MRYRIEVTIGANIRRFRYLSGASFTRISVKLHHTKPNNPMDHPIASCHVAAPQKNTVSEKVAASRNPTEFTIMFRIFILLNIPI